MSTNALLVVRWLVVVLLALSRFQCFAEIEMGAFAQPLDHFSDSKSPEFQQTYFVQNKHYRSGGPVFLYSVGERMATSSDIEDGWIDVLARETHGLIVLLELRFYGDSSPQTANGDNATSNSLEYLTVKQMMADIRRFIQYVNLPDVKQNKDGAKTRKGNVPWVFVGGSFAGSLMAWTKQQYPESNAFVVASSAPMVVKDGYWEFDEMVAKRLPCAHNLSLAMQQLDDELDNGDSKTFAAIKGRFGLEEIPSAGLFVSSLAIQVPLLMQAPARQQTLEQINDFCANLSASSLAHVTRAFSKIHRIMPQVGCPKGDDRSWFWQQCLELGMWQTAPLPADSTHFNSRLRSRRLTAEYFRGQCAECFPTSQGRLADEKKQTFRAFAQRALESLAGTIAAGDALFTVGELDPWRYLTLDARSSTLNSSRIIVIPGASHVEDLLGPLDSDAGPGERPAIQNVRLVIVREVSQWSQDFQHRSNHNRTTVAHNSNNVLQGVHETVIRAKGLSCFLLLFAIFVLVVLYKWIRQ